MNNIEENTFDKLTLRDFQKKLINNYLQNQDNDFQIVLSSPRQYGATFVLLLLASIHARENKVIFVTFNVPSVRNALKKEKNVIVCNYKNLKEIRGFDKTTLIILDNLDIYLKDNEFPPELQFYKKIVYSKLSSTYLFKKNKTFSLISANKEEVNIDTSKIRHIIGNDQYQIEYGLEELLSVRNWYLYERETIYSWFSSTYNRNLSYDEVIDKIDEYKVVNCKKSELISFRELVDAITIYMFGTERELRTSNVWLNYHIEQQNKKYIIISDPDGWDRSNYYFSFYEQRISYEEFMRRLSFSTTLTK